jgi:putative flippase GtrA
MKKIKKYILYSYEVLNKFIFNKLFKRNLNKDTFLQMVKHSFVGFISAVLNYLGFNFLMIIGFEIKVSNIITYIFVIIVSFVFQKYFTYKIKYNSILQPILFIANALIYYILDTTILIIFINNLSISAWVSKLISILILFPLSFFSQKYIVFRRFRVKNIK